MPGVPMSWLVQEVGKLVAVEVTVRLRDAVWVKAPLVPVIVSG